VVVVVVADLSVMLAVQDDDVSPEIDGTPKLE